MYIYIYIYIYETERERERGGEKDTELKQNNKDKSMNLIRPLVFYLEELFSSYNTRRCSFVMRVYEVINSSTWQIIH